MKKLPTWDVLKGNYPALAAPAVFKQIGGKVELNYDIGVFENACATRVSKALNDSGSQHKIKFFKALGANGKFEAQVSSGKNKNWYIFRVQMLIKHLSENYGSPETFTPTEYTQKIKGRKGIIIYEVNGWSNASGHADLWNGSSCVYQGYGDVSHKIYFWEAS
jgi:hypothetical protein